MIGKIKKDLITSNGALHKGDKVDIVHLSENIVTIKDSVGRIYYIDRASIRVEK